MMIIAMLAVMATQPNPLLLPWVQGDLSTKGMYAKYGRLEPDGTYSTLSATKSVCETVRRAAGRLARCLAVPPARVVMM